MCYHATISKKGGDRRADNENQNQEDRAVYWLREQYLAGCLCGTGKWEVFLP